MGRDVHFNTDTTKVDRAYEVARRLAQEAGLPSPGKSTSENMYGATGKIMINGSGAAAERIAEEVERIVGGSSTFTYETGSQTLRREQQEEQARRAREQTQEYARMQKAQNFYMQTLEAAAGGNLQAQMYLNGTL